MERIGMTFAVMLAVVMLLSAFWAFINYSGTTIEAFEDRVSGWVGEVLGH